MTPPQVEYRIVELTRGQVTYVSPLRFESLNCYKWYARWDKRGQRFYAVRNSEKVNGKRHQLFMHREILGLKYGNPLTGDHKDRTRTLDNTDGNLRVASWREQGMNRGAHRDNTSGYKGVSFHNATGKWVAQINVDGKRKHLGLFDTKESAYVAYCAALKLHYGEFACLG